MIARFLNKGRIVLEKDVKKLEFVMEKMPGVLAKMRKGHTSLSDGKNIVWFFKKDGNKNILCFPFTHYYKYEVSDYVGIYIFRMHQDGSWEDDFKERSFGIPVSQNDEKGKRRSSNFVRNLIKKISVLPDWESMTGAINKESKRMDGFCWATNSF